MGSSPTTNLKAWLSGPETAAPGGKYWHLELRENQAHRSAALPDLKSYVQVAHQDARRRLRNLATVSLDPLKQEPVRDAAFGYPWMLDSITLQGYLGEVFAGLVAEQFGALGATTWEVPAFLFRFHDYAFDVLEKWQQGGRSPGRVPGRPGNDCVAFERQGNGDIARILVCEAKCTLDHDATLIRDAHTTVSDPATKSVSILKLVDILKDQGDPSAMRWIEALLRFWGSAQEAERCDMVVYLCGRSPARPSSTWIPAVAPVAVYSGGRPLEAAEVHLADVADLLNQVYRQQADWNGTIP